MLDMKWASITELDGQWRRSPSGKLWVIHRNMILFKAALFIYFAGNPNQNMNMNINLLQEATRDLKAP